MTRVRGAILARTKLKPQWDVHLGPTVVNIPIRRVLPLPNAPFLRKPESGMVKFRPPQLKPGTLDAGMTAVTLQIPKNVVFTMALV